LERAGLARAYLQGAWLDDAHLEGAGLEGAHLERASLTDAHLEEARLDDAHLEQAWLADADLKRARASAGTAWPKGFQWRDAGVIRTDKSPSDPTGAETEATTADVVGDGTMEPLERENYLPDTAQAGSDGDSEPRNRPTTDD
jgi:uncharacterized protein YjbI with pentapeptide repeats